MTSKYVVSCYSPPNQLAIDNGDIVDVKVKTKSGNKVVAAFITNNTKKGQTCNCGVPPRALLAEEVLRGKASNVKFISGMGVQFDLEEIV
jgi:hypothetical protein